MRKTLLHSYLVVVFFWWGLALTWFSLANPNVNRQALARLAHFAPWLHLAVPKQASALNALAMQLTVLKYWSIPILGLTVLFGLLGAALSAGLAGYLVKKREAREKAGSKGWRNLRITLGEIPKPEELPRLEADLLVEEGQETEGIQKALQDQPKGYRQLIQEILEVLAAHPEAYTGAGHGVSLLEHSLGVLENALREFTPDTDPLVPIAAIAHDLGKITAFQKNEDGEWTRVKWHDKETARILAMLPGWWSLDPVDREVLLLAVKYDHSSGNMPFFEDGIRARAIKLQIALAKADRTVTASEKEAVLANLSLPEMALEAFLRVLPTLPLHVAGHAPPKNVKAAGWKKDGILYLLEHQCRERVMAALDPETAAALGGNYRPQHKLARFTEELMKGLHEKGWLIQEFNGGKVPPDEAMWIIMSGTKEFKSVLALRIVPELADKLPETDTAYTITVTGSLKPSVPGEMSAASVDLSSLLRKPKKQPAVEEPAETEVVPSSGPEIQTPAPFFPQTPVLEDLPATEVTPTELLSEAKTTEAETAGEKEDEPGPAGTESPENEIIRMVPSKPIPIPAKASAISTAGGGDPVAQPPQDSPAPSHPRPRRLKPRSPESSPDLDTLPRALKNQEVPKRKR